MKRIGVDVGGTHTDAVLMSDDQVIASVKAPTTVDVMRGIENALAELLSCVPDRDVRAVMIGTTHYTNAVVERKRLNCAAAIRICLPASASLPPFCDWPADLAARVNGGVYLVRGGHEYDGREIVPLDERAIASAARQLRAAQVNAVAISAVFSPTCGDAESRAAEIVRNEHPEAQITCSSALGRIGLLERENVALLNAALIELASEMTHSMETALSASGIEAELFITQNDGTIARADTARQHPVYSFASGPVNSMRGAALLGGVPDAMVCDVGGTTTDVGCLINGFPRQANNVVQIGGVRTLFRIPDVLSIGIGGGTIIRQADAIQVGPHSVGYQLTKKALVFGGDTLTCTDIAVAAGLIDIGDKSRVAHLPATTVDAALHTIHDQISQTVDRMKNSAAEVPLLAVGGGSMLVPDNVPGISHVLRVPHDGVANAVGAAIAQISGETDRIYRDTERDQALADAREHAIARAVEGGANAATIEVVESEDFPLSYLPGKALRVRVRVVGQALL
jgi:N-methylhydantoinase A/oxoprolinase/acetone carboxylase beta subunit